MSAILYRPQCVSISIVTSRILRNVVLVRLFLYISRYLSSQWWHNGRDGISNHQPRDCLFSRLIRRRSKKTSKRHVTGFCAGNSSVTGEIPAQMASNTENVSIWWRHNVLQRTQKRHPLAYPQCLLWVYTLNKVLASFPSCCAQYCVIHLRSILSGAHGCRLQIANCRSSVTSCRTL